VEADEVAGEQPAQDLPVPGQDPVQVVGRERHVQEERDAGLRLQAAQMGRGAHQLVVVDPGQPRAVAGLGGEQGEALVHRVVGDHSRRSSCMRVGNEWKSGQSVRFAKPW